MPDPITPWTPEHPPTCGTNGTPPCPSATFINTLESTIDQLAGQDATAEHRATIRASMEAFLIAAMSNVVALDRIADISGTKRTSPQRDVGAHSGSGKIGNSDQQRMK